MQVLQRLFSVLPDDFRGLTDCAMDAEEIPGSFPNKINLGNELYEIGSDLGYLASVRQIIPLLWYLFIVQGIPQIDTNGFVFVLFTYLLMSSDKYLTMTIKSE